MFLTLVKAEFPFYKCHLSGPHMFLVGPDKLSSLDEQTSISLESLSGPSLNFSSDPDKRFSNLAMSEQTQL